MRQLSDKIIADFWAKVDKTGGCWNWTGRLNAKGMPTIYDDNWTELSAKKMSLQLSLGVDSTGRLIITTCDNKLCVNPAHLAHDVEAKFWARVEKSDGCWNWKGSLRKGYGYISWDTGN